MGNQIIEAAVNLTESERIKAAKQYPGPSSFVHLHNHTLVVLQVFQTHILLLKRTRLNLFPVARPTSHKIT